VQVPVNTGLTITVNVEAEYTAIEVTGENIVIPEAYYIPVDSNILTQLVSFHFDYNLSELKFGLEIWHVCKELLWAYLMMVIPKTRREHQVRYLSF
jgi:hypothetical protein